MGEIRGGAVVSITEAINKKIQSDNNQKPEQFFFRYYHLTEALEYISRKYDKDPDELFSHIQEDTETLGDEFLTFENHAGVVFDLLRKEFGEKTVYYDD